jgi:hypothetical protein
MCVLRVGILKNSCKKISKNREKSVIFLDILRIKNTYIKLSQTTLLTNEIYTFLKIPKTGVKILLKSV